ncbi:lipopolysaccharide kinase InaA family protein [Chryseobacterium caseinilyticum]|uniref:Lipopolysaccharide kinase n=1 Tax=Chryseobacterium caseinilyticum TaxID=2771428 RepID=A0ABR8ZD49_9FLAO|nr:lipopolysaccharide kinase InaA family protein [Chryseobacterium caseinilyticum]MBD8083193.1 lipopolysaccharide kinase [Chryseobacterium caseinilyticum]
MKSFYADGFRHVETKILNVLKNFKTGGILIGPGSRNVVKIFDIDGERFNFKSFKQHNVINRHVYKYYRKSKAKRSFEYAQLLLSKGFHTPEPVAYIENFDFWGVTSSYYISRQLEDSPTLMEVIVNQSFPEREKIIREYAQLIFRLHEEGFEFLDNAPGNFIIKNESGRSQFYMVDLNRMSFHQEMNLDKRLKNFARLTSDSEVIRMISDEYAQLVGSSGDYCFNRITEAINGMVRKRKMKKILKFYKFLLPKR